MYLISGVTGHTGKAAAETLLGRGQPVRVLVRKAEQGAPWKARGAEVAVGSLDDEAALTSAFAGARGAYVLSPPDLGTSDLFALRAGLIDAVERAATRSQLPHLVFLSSIGAHQPKDTGPIALLGQAERRFEQLGIGVTFVRASYFLENYAGVLPAARKDGVLPVFMPADFVHSVVATADIGRTVAQALLDGPRGRRVIELSGPADVTPTDVAATVARLLNRPVTVVEVPLHAVVPTFMSFGMSQHMGELYREMYEGFLAGTVAWEGTGERARGTIGLEEGLRQLLG
jgi:NAD(P)H dehydrogenase (quinone)